MNVAVELGAGQSASVEQNLSQLYVMESPGVYLVSAECSVGDETGIDYIKSNILRITIQ